METLVPAQFTIVHFHQLFFFSIVFRFCVLRALAIFHNIWHQCCVVVLPFKTHSRSGSNGKIGKETIQQTRRIVCLSLRRNMQWHFFCVVHFRWIIQIELKPFSAKFFLPLSWMIAFDDWTLDTVPKRLIHIHHAVPIPRPCRAAPIHTYHAVPMPRSCRAALIHIWHAAPLPCSDTAVSFVKVRVVAGNIRTASPTV